MASSKKKRVAQDMENLETTGNDEEMMSEDMDQQNVEHVEVDFEAHTAEESDFHGIQKLLQQLFLKSHIHTGELADTIISQNYVGSVLKQVEQEEDMEDDDDETFGSVFGVVTVLNITDRQKLDSIKTLKTFLLTKCSECAASKRDKLQSVLSDQSNHVGYLINERFINIPPQIAVPTLQCLWNEMTAANARKMKYKFSHYLMLSKTYKHQLVKGGAEQTIFVNSEEELFHQESLLSFDYSVRSEHDAAMSGNWDEDEELDPYRTVMLIAADKIPIIMAKMSELYAAPIH